MKKQENSGNADLKGRVFEYLKGNLSAKRLKHTENVRKTVRKLAKKYGEDPEKAELAALFHDMYRELPGNELESYITKYGLENSRYSTGIELAHGKLAAAAMRKEYGITDDDMINAVSFHTTGRAGMSGLEKILFMADAVEPGRNYPGVESLRKVLQEDLDCACLIALRNTINFLKEKNVRVDPDTTEAERYFSNKRKRMK